MPDITKCPGVVAAKGPDGKPVVLKAGAQVSLRDWEHVSANPGIVHMLRTGDMVVELTIDEIVARQFPAEPEAPEEVPDDVA